MNIENIPIYQIFYRALYCSFLFFNRALFELLKIFLRCGKFCAEKFCAGGKRRANENQFWNGKRIDLIVRNVRG